MFSQASPNPTSVMIVEDDAVTRKMLSLAVESAPHFRLVAQFDSVKPALAWLETIALPEVNPGGAGRL